MSYIERKRPQNCGMRRNIMKIVVLAGGISTEREISIVSGTQVCKALRSRGHQAILVDVYFGREDADPMQAFTDEYDVDAAAAYARSFDSQVEKSIQEGKAFFGTNVIALCQAADVVFLALHGENGENGKVQAAFDLLGIRYTGSGYLGSAIAMDVRKGPLSRAQEHISQYGLDAYIETRLSDGLEALKPGEGDTLVIAGMGGPLMERILTDGAEVRESFREMILQPQSDIPHFRRFVRKIGWQITEEEMVLEDGKFYPMMKVIHGEKMHISEDTPYTLDEWFGGMLLERKHPVLREYLERELRIRNEILDRLKNAPNAEKRAGEIEEEKQAVIVALEEYEGI